MLFNFSSPGVVSINMDKYINDILVKYSSIRGIVATPAKDDFLTVDASSPLLNDSDKADFHSLVARLLYLAKRVRPDILFPVVWLSTKVQSPSSYDFAKLKRVVRYLRGTPTLGIVLTSPASSTLDFSIDASFGVHADAKSHTGVVVSYGYGPLFASSRKQSIVTKSSTEAELVGTADASGIIHDILGTLRDLGETIPHAVVHQDNQSTIRMIYNGEPTSQRSKHINIKYYYLKQLVDDGIVIIQYLSTEEMIADILTKPLQGEAFRIARDRLLNLA
jgi:hypothetical protein